MLDALYPSRDPRLSILLMEDGGNPVGWAACFDTQMKEAQLFWEAASGMRGGLSGETRGNDGDRNRGG